MLKRKLIRREWDIPGNWKDILLSLWIEDDAPVPDKEDVQSAFTRIVGKYHGEPITTIDEGDTIFSFYRDGWVKVVSYEGGAVCVLVEAK